jgi:F-type H+/Na+-transporting ATPase subunit alpha
MLDEILEKVSGNTEKILSDIKAEPIINEIGRVISIGDGVAVLSGLPKVKYGELLDFNAGVTGMAYNLDADKVGAILFGRDESLDSGSLVRRTHRVADINVGKELMGKVIDPVGNLLVGSAVSIAKRWPIERDAPAILKRAPVTQPLQTGIKAVDSLIPIGKGQRQLILGDRQTGKTAIAIDTIINQRAHDVMCIYCSIGQSGSSIARIISDLENHDAMEHTIIITAGSDSPPGLQFIAPYAAMTIAEYFMESGGDALVIFDDLTKHARAYRELSLLLERTPGREAYPGDVFYIHSRLLERATHLRSGGSLTAMPIIETQAQNISAYIPTNLISITDGQIYLSPELYQKGNLPAIDIGRSVSRVGGKTQLPAYRKVTSDLRLTYSQFEELETFSKFGTRLEESTRRKLERGKRIRKILNQVQFEPLDVCEQIVVLLSVTKGLFDDIDPDDVSSFEAKLLGAMSGNLSEICSLIRSGEELSDEDIDKIVETAKKILNTEKEE